MKKIITLLILVLLLSSCILSSPTVNIYFSGGQSNATKIWSDSIANEIFKVDPTAIIIHNNHSGQSIKRWSENGVRKSSYLLDIEKIKTLIQLKQYDFKGFFWFQGEQDHMDRNNDYVSDFNSMISFFQEDLQDYDFDIFMTIIYMNGMIDNSDIRNMQREIINNNDNVYGIDSIDYFRWDGLHLSEPEARRLGKDTGWMAVNIIY